MPWPCWVPHTRKREAHNKAPVDSRRLVLVRVVRSSRLDEQQLGRPDRMQPERIHTMEPEERSLHQHRKMGLGVRNWALVRRQGPGEHN